MKKFVVLLVLLLVCGTVYADSGEKISVLMISERTFNQSPEMLDVINKATVTKFPLLRYDTKVFGKDSTPAISEFMERYNKDGSIVVTKANALQYGKDASADKLIVIRIVPVDVMQWYNGAGGSWSRCKVSLEIKGFSIADEKYIADQTFSTQERERPQKGLENVVTDLKKWQLPIELQ